jgi:D-3-phosphoglycerate dehydrogenase
VVWEGSRPPAREIIVVPDDFPSIFSGSPAHRRSETLGDVRVFTERGADDEAELIRRIDRAGIVINIRAHARFTEAVFAGCPRLRMISIWGTGTDNVDLAVAGRHGVTVSNTPGVNAYAVAEHALALMLAVARRIPQIDRDMRAGAWPRELVTQLCGKTLGVFGLGRIGSRMAALGAAIGMDVRSWSARRDDQAAKERILAAADVVTLHLRLSPETRGFLGPREFAMMKPSAILVNTGRGALVDREALLEALKQQRLAGAGLDVFHDEPLRSGDAVVKLPTVVLSPHNAGQTPEVIHDGLLRAVQNVEHYLEGRPTDVVVEPVGRRK